MSLAAARRFICRIADDSDLRRLLNGVCGPDELTAVLERSVGNFSIELFDEAIRAYQVRCQTELQAEELEDLRKWWHCLTASIARGP